MICCSPGEYVRSTAQTLDLSHFHSFSYFFIHFLRRRRGHVPYDFVEIPSMLWSQATLAGNNGSIVLSLEAFCESHIRRVKQKDTTINGTELHCNGLSAHTCHHVRVHFNVISPAAREAHAPTCSNHVLPICGSTFSSNTSTRGTWRATNGTRPVTDHSNPTFRKSSKWQSERT